MTILTLNSSIKPFTLPSNDYNLRDLELSYTILGDNNPTFISGSSGPSRICTDGNNGAIVTWGRDRIQAQKIDSYGNTQWIAGGIPVSPNYNWLYCSDICSDEDSGAIITWHCGSVWDQFDIYAQKINSTGEMQWDPNGMPICTAIGGQATPRICSDGTGGAIFVWRDYRAGDDPSSTLCDVYVQRINSTGNIQWDTNGILVVDSNIYMNSGGVHPDIMSDGEGGAIILWEDRIYESGRDIFAQRIDPNGNFLWGSSGVSVCTADSTQTLPVMCSDGLGGAIFTWEDDRYSPTSRDNIYAQRINSTGDIQWNVNGIPICTAEGIQDYIQICEDGEGGAYITWSDAYSERIIFGQKINSKGSIYWQKNGIIIAEPYDLYRLGAPVLYSDKKKGAIISWTEYNYESPYYNLLVVQQINSEGRKNWINNGLIIRNITRSFRYAEICSDENGNVLLTWEDDSLGDYDIYSQIITNLNEIPTSNNPDDITTIQNLNQNINWILYDDYGGGLYRVIVNDPNNNTNIFIDWTEWQNDSTLEIPIDTSIPGNYCFTIEYCDNSSQLGISDSVFVEIVLNDVSYNNINYIPFGNFYLIFFSISLSLILLIIWKKNSK
ncbi:MAG: hypothetical protein ACFFBP_00645 [Promethearchaeota archaeon]